MYRKSLIFISLAQSGSECHAVLIKQDLLVHFETIQSTNLPRRIGKVIVRRKYG